MAIPYATWANRGRGQMIVWLAARPKRSRGRRRFRRWRRRDRHGVGAGHGRGKSPRRSTTARRRRRPTTRPRTSTGGRAGQRDRVGRMTFAEAGDGVASRGLLVRRHRPRRGAGAGVWRVLYNDGDDVEAGRRRRRLRRRAGSLQHASLQAGHRPALAARGDDAAELLGRPAGVDGEVAARRSAARCRYDGRRAAVPSGRYLALHRRGSRSRRHHPGLDVWAGGDECGDGRDQLPDGRAPRGRDVAPAGRGRHLDRRDARPQLLLPAAGRDLHRSPIRRTGSRCSPSSPSAWSPATSRPRPGHARTKRSAGATSWPGCST